LAEDDMDEYLPLEKTGFIKIGWQFRAQTYWSIKPAILNLAASYFAFCSDLMI
jgi:hypothetical protein